MGRESMRGFLQAMYQMAVMALGGGSGEVHDAKRTKRKARPLRLYSPDALPQARFEYTLERTRLSGAPPASHVVRSGRPYAGPSCEIVVVFRANVVFAVTQRVQLFRSGPRWRNFPGGWGARRGAARMKWIVAEVRSGGKAKMTNVAFGATSRENPACAGRARRRVRPESGRGRWRGIGAWRVFRAFRADGGRIYHKPGAGECNNCATNARSPFDRRGLGKGADSPARRPVDIRTEGPQDERSRTIRRRNEVPSEARNDGPRHAAAWRGPQIFAKMSGMLDLSRDEKAKHLLPR